MKKDKISDFTLRITQCNRSGLIVVIYDMVLEYIDDAAECYELDNKDGFIDATKKARECVGKLMSSLDTKYPIALELMQLYVYINKLLITSVIKKKPQDFEAIKRMIHNLADAFREVAKQDTSGPMMGNTQQIYAGLTYGKGTLTESYSKLDSNRGFRV
ncbi:MAG: flagellar protein FliS [Lachnotalea sp.]